MIAYKNGLIWVSEDEKFLEYIKHINHKKFRENFVFYPSEVILKKPEIFNEIKGIELTQPPKIRKEPTLRKYQDDAYKKWSEKKRGVIIMPTGTGKTLVGIKAICSLAKSTLCVVPTLSLVDQWIEKIKEFSEDVGEWSGRKKNLSPITITTYDSASISAEFLGNKFELIIFDEVHHLPSENYRKIALLSVAPYRMGLTATVEREDNLHELIKEFVGDFYRIEFHDVRDFIAQWDIKQIKVRMNQENYQKYRELMRKYVNFCVKRGLDPSNKSTIFDLIKASSYSQEAREALIAHRIAKDISKNSDEKIEIVRELLQKHKEDKTIIFTDSQSMAYKISEAFFIPCITSEIPNEERKKYIQGFSSGVFPAIVSAHVLDEGVDVPDASCAIIVSGSSSAREFIQRLGRILRPSKPKAVLYEIISAGTSEKFSSERRKNKIITNKTEQQE
ncbi:MAG: DEAD/DEAH box helicase [Candidatus Calescibacterium sp.]|nr:DEAD/DEAH box helicase [Candidatus Calescibacterium sp.]MCX7733735.1 DEAD/DEAH box helicase [bacterium]